ncbi:MAG: acyltransferase [Alphaproteobacteria bacterium]|nr:acyltransferase [Candidatus Fonsibacter sp. PEL55]
MKLTYRPEIDGLRAIAVGAVILYHAQITILGHQPFKGGFIGVDIFFLISGYLITSIILKELVTRGSFSFKHFYERRIRRILPALLFVMLVSLPFAWMYLLPSSFIDFSKSILYSLGFSSNYYFWYSGHQYGAESGFLKPFLHTWSLSVEEQFYILFPIVLLIVFKYFYKNLIHILILGFIISLGLADWGSRNHPSLNFYLLPTRAWELLAGSILAYFEITLGHRSKNKILNLILPSIGLILIGYSILFFNDKMFHPSFYTLSPIIGVCLIIWFSHKDELITKILSLKLFVGIGLISYSLYLWHYPIFAFDRIYEFIQGSLLKKLLLGIIILALSIFSYYFIEKPFRNKHYKFKTILSLILISISILVILNFNIVHKDGYKDRFYISDKYELSSTKYAEENKKFELNYNYDNYDNRKNVLIVGNSHAEDLLEILSKTNLINKVYFNLVSPKIRENDYNFQIEYLHTFLKEKKAIIDYYSGDFFNHLKKQYDNSDLIILSTYYSAKDLEILDELIKILKQDKKEILIFDNALHQNLRSGLNRLDYYVFTQKKLPEIKTLKQIENKIFLDLKNKENINLQILNIAKNNNVALIEREKIFCDVIKKECPAITDDGYKIYWDYGHITDKGAEFFARRIEKDKLFLKYLKSTIHLSSN